jgi:hypothetical protein
MAQIDKPNLHFTTTLYTGNGTTDRAVTVGFQPDWIWCKERSATESHMLHDVHMNAGDYIRTNTADGLSNSGEMFKSITSTGFTVGTRGEVNQNSQTYANWSWKGGGTPSANNVGSTASSVSVNTTSGFSVVTWTGTGSATTVGHGLGATPELIIIKNKTDSVNWMLFHRSMIAPGATNKEFFELNATAGLQANGSATTFTSTSNTTFGVGTDNKLNGSGDAMVAYVFAPKKGFSKFGKYTGNGNADGTFVYTGFKPAFVIQKQQATRDWTLIDNTRSPFNAMDDRVVVNTSTGEVTNNATDFVSNGFKCRGTETNTNESGGTYLYWAFAENPIVGSNNVPAVAR